MSKPISVSRWLTRRAFFQAFGITFAGFAAGCGELGRSRGKTECSVCGGLGTIMQKMGEEEMRSPCYFCRGTGYISR